MRSTRTASIFLAGILGSTAVATAWAQTPPAAPVVPPAASPATPAAAPLPKPMPAPDAETDAMDPASMSAASAKAEQADRARAAEADRAAFFDARVAALHAGLTLTPDQEKLWPALEQAIRGVAAMRETLRDHRTDQRQDETDRQGLDAAGAIEGLKITSDDLLIRGKALGALADAASPLYATLSADQKRRLPMLLHDIAMERSPVGMMVRGMIGEDAGQNGEPMRGDRMMHGDMDHRRGGPDAEREGGPRDSRAADEHWRADDHMGDERDNRGMDRKWDDRGPARDEKRAGGWDREDRDGPRDMRRHHADREQDDADRGEGRDDRRMDRADERHSYSGEEDGRSSYDKPMPRDQFDNNRND
ncbi:Spy/CpxP family protein refolding chaperone [Lichenihabitans sp. PAMC28606]|uniref:Spy/CpxP family protein refolding chaperone n=1 Tax=Lichenihabitans sp. PAMC28606 TaxID=2880932 RepID=UPI001D0B58B8|nr:Spy/CpxP family protein refolding chaperone [Lichenihabitans sp. PAMC28606]UDL95678.1 Spy/CpxP family protein refolding chaperone [Lichenihabitans sp. PAMC28606]